METVEMDLMQAQIGSLATDVSRLEAKVSKGESDGDILIANISEITPQSLTQFTAKSTLTSAEIKEAMLSNKIVCTIVDASALSLGVFTCPITVVNQYDIAWGYFIMGFHDRTDINGYITLSINEDGDATINVTAAE